jgi:DNA-binding IclR family transcriptional regulator
MPSWRASVILGALDQTQMVVLEVCHGSNAFHIRREIGERLPHGTTALGRAYLAGLDGARYEQALTALEQRVPKAQARADHAEHGFVFSLGDWMPELYAVGVPLPIQGGERLLALSVNGPVYSMTRERLVGEVGPALLRARDAILQRVG